MGMDRIGALRRERAQMLRFCRELSDAEWRTESAAPGWRVQDVIAHIGSGCHAIFTPASLTMLRSTDIERTNDEFVEQRRTWSPSRVLTEYERWSGRLVRIAGTITRTPLSRARAPRAALGRFPVGLLLVAAPVFDHHTHLRHDIAPALGRPAPDTDATRMTLVLEWMFAVLGNQLASTRPAWLDRPLALTVHGPGGGSWRIGADGTVARGPANDTAAQISASAREFPEWGTRRARWRDRDVRITGDREYGARFLDGVNVV